jgi:hypothetical protein
LATDHRTWNDFGFWIEIANPESAIQNQCARCVAHPGRLVAFCLADFRFISGISPFTLAFTGVCGSIVDTVELCRT